MQTGYDLAEKATCSKIQYNNRRTQVLVDRTLCCPPFFFFFINIDFFSYKQHFATFYVSLYDIYTINTIKQ